VQVSSAVHVPWDSVAGDATAQSQMLAQVQSFHEPKYLHQTTVASSGGQLSAIAEDLDIALKRWTSPMPTTPWRIHFHVPIFVSSFGKLETTQADILLACRYLQNHKTFQVADRDWFTGHYEVETYAWPVLPSELAEADLAAGIAKEIDYFASILQSIS
jgi:hypothetical protein